MKSGLWPKAWLIFPSINASQALVAPHPGQYKSVALLKIQGGKKTGRYRIKIPQQKQGEKTAVRKKDQVTLGENFLEERGMQTDDYQ